jgi:hypothetical protein
MEFQPKEVGRGVEGVVVQIAPNLVKKTWTGWLLQGEGTLDGIVCRILSTEKELQTLPKKYKQYCAVPEFAGFEINECGKVVTYHEYIKAEPLDKFIEMCKPGVGDTWNIPGIPVATELIVLLETRLADFCGDNARVAGAKIYVLDCPAISHL